MEVKHDPVGQKFYIPLGKEEAIVAYTQINEYLDVHQVVVPVSHQGKGIAEYIVKYVFEHAKKHNMKIIPSCSYVKDKFIPEHPEYSDIVGKEIS